MLNLRVASLVFLTGICLWGLTACSGSGSPSGCQPGATCIVQQCGAIGSQVCDQFGNATCKPPQELCANGIDDDCDGAIDEDCGGSQTCSQPNQKEACLTSCQTVGERICLGGIWSQCTPPVESCDLLDNNCNGQIDESLIKQCETDCGIGTKSCISGVWGSCSAPTPKAEECNGLDDDCNNLIDEGPNNQALTQVCNQGCGVGIQSCANGQWGPCSQVPEPEICDGKDNNCNGIIDDAVGGCTCMPGETKQCGENIGECNKGTQTCVLTANGNTQWTECGGPSYNSPSAELCNGLDDDCDGFIDEDANNSTTGFGAEGGLQACGISGPGLCHVGTKNCLGGQLLCVDGYPSECVPGNCLPNQYPPEVCNGLDDNCDGQVDNNVGADQWEPNDSCTQATSLGYVLENQGPTNFEASLFNPSGTDSVDWFVVTAKEGSGFCLPNQTEGPWSVTITLTGIPAGADYDLCVFPVQQVNSVTNSGPSSCGQVDGNVCGGTTTTGGDDSCQWANDDECDPTPICDQCTDCTDCENCATCQTSGGGNNNSGFTAGCECHGIFKSGNQPETYSASWSGQCLQNDDRDFYVKVVSYANNPEIDCAPYTLSVTVTK